MRSTKKCRRSIVEQLHIAEDETIVVTNRAEFTTEKGRPIHTGIKITNNECCQSGMVINY